MTTIKKTIAGFVGFAIALSLVAVSPAQAAMTSAELASQIAALQAQLAALSGGTTTTTTSSSSYSFTRDLTIGSTGADVTALQSWLISKGFSIPAGATGYFGGQTQAAVSAYQAARGISPTAGYFGPTTRARVASEGGSTTTTTTDGGTTTTTTTTSDLDGTDGTISDINQLSQYSSEEVGEGEEEVKVLGFEVEASNDGDIALKSIKLRFDPTGNVAADSDHLDDYISGVKVWFGDKEIGSADVDDFNEESSNDTYTKTITLSNAVVRSDDTEKFYVTVDAVNSFDSSDIDSDSWTVAIDSLRFEDGSGVVTTETSAIDTAIDWDSTGDGVAISFVDFSTSADIELKLSKSSDSPDEQVVSVDDTDNTDDVVLLKGKIKLEGTSDVTIDEFPVMFTTVGGATVSAVTGSATLKIGDEEYSESVSITGATTGTVTFDNMDFVIEAGDTVEFEVLADINDIETGTFDEGDTLKAEVTALARYDIDVEDEEGDQLTDSTEKTGTSLGDAQTFRTSGLDYSVSTKKAESVFNLDTTATDDEAKYTFEIKVSAFDDVSYIKLDSARGTTTSPTAGVNYVIEGSDGVATTSSTVSATVEFAGGDGEETSGGYLRLEDGEEATLRVILNWNPAHVLGTSASYRARVDAINFNDTEAAPDTVQTLRPETDYRTGFISVQN
ncbi:MAG: Peptidoglycan-binding protein [Patescibacteria group bacterium]|jgi:peptidoglycan hydrolase-like protein with peptidoglycan-binding domain|nr:Peptidoglycan-binding protein [Patescibacteria group bacterium]